MHTFNYATLFESLLFPTKGAAHRLNGILIFLEGLQAHDTSSHGTTNTPQDMRVQPGTLLLKQLNLHTKHMEMEVRHNKVFAQRSSVFTHSPVQGTDSNKTKPPQVQGDIRAIQHGWSKGRLPHTGSPLCLTDSTTWSDNRGLQTETLHSLHQ